MRQFWVGALLLSAISTSFSYASEQQLNRQALLDALKVRSEQIARLRSQADGGGEDSQRLFVPWERRQPLRHPLSPEERQFAQSEAQSALQVEPVDWEYLGKCIGYLLDDTPDKTSEALALQTLESFPKFSIAKDVQTYLLEVTIRLLVGQETPNAHAVLVQLASPGELEQVHPAVKRLFAATSSDEAQAVSVFAASRVYFCADLQFAKSVIETALNQTKNDPERSAMLKEVASLIDEKIAGVISPGSNGALP